MDRTRNPYSPGAGVPPQRLVGRSQELQLWQTALQRLESGRHDRGVMIHGLRGVGKTVLLGQLRNLAEQRRWVALQIEARAGVAESARAVVDAAVPVLRPYAKPSLGARMRTALGSVSALKATVDPASGALSFGIDIAAQASTSGEIATDLVGMLLDLAAAIHEESGTGLALLVDEMQDLDASLIESIATAAHLASQRGIALLVSGAGLPSLPSRLAAAKTYSERLFHFRALGILNPADAQTALTDPSRSEGVVWDDDAARIVIAAAAGYPYFIQEFGQATWDAAQGPTRITRADAERGIEAGTAVLDQGFFRSRWDRATASERQYMVAMAADDPGPSSTADLAARLNRRQQSLGPARAGLVGKGLIYVPEHGRVAFTVPGMAQFIARQAEGGPWGWSTGSA